MLITALPEQSPDFGGVRALQMQTTAGISLPDFLTLE